ncbi:MAG: hypothetical protein IJX62_01165 [Clostridia bacterium]|nr:hypothetical protein [Clostridia bacterium]
MKRNIRVLSVVLATVMLLTSLMSCSSCQSGNNNGTVIDNENTRLVLSTSELDGVFNPFYSSSAPDGSIVGMTQISLLSSDKNGKVAFGADEACVVLDYETEFVEDADGNIINTIYRFVLKNNVKFSNGSPLTMKDVLFNLYVYLDPAYYGSATIYSTDIVGLEEYRTQSDNASERDEFMATFEALASDRIQRLKDCLETVYDAHKNESLTMAGMESELTAVMNEIVELGEGYESYGTVLDDYKLAEKYFREELEKDYNYARGTAQDIVHTDKNGNKVTLTTDTEAFLYNEGLITWNKDEYKYEYSLGEKSKDWTEEAAIQALFESYFPNDVDTVVTYWATANELHTYFSYLEMQEYFKENESKYENISGIRYANRTESVTVNGTEYGVPTIAADGSVTSGNEVLEITINKVDPKAIWNFGFTVAPMYYYSNQEQISKFDYEKNFGVEFGSIEFMDAVIKNPDKLGVPVGAGPYKATTRSGDSSAVTAGTFWEDNVVRFERNEHFMFDVKIKYINYQVVSTNLMLDTLYSGGVHFVEPACKQENIDSLAARASEGFSSSFVMTNGYGYIGINAEKVPNLNVRRAIMHAINTKHAVDYYLGYSYSIYRPMTMASWAYPDDVAAQQYYNFDETGAISEQLVKDAGYTKNSDGIYQKGTDVCKYVFTIAGDTTDHPAYNSLKQAAEILNAHGFSIEVKTDINALSKLNNGDLTVWAAAWGAGIDPDMYQVYHLDSTAGSTANWGYRAIRKNAGGKYDEELALVKELSGIIDAARETLDEDRRKEFYAEALDIVMELAVELPTYQRSDLFAYNSDVIDASTLTPKEDLTPYNGPLSKIWEVSLKETVD